MTVEKRNSVAKTFYVKLKKLNKDISQNEE